MVNFIFLQKEAEIQNLKVQLTRYAALTENLETEKKSLEEKCKLSQVQKEIFYDESEIIQNSQHSEITKLKTMLHFREQVDRQSMYL